MLYPKIERMIAYDWVAVSNYTQIIKLFGDNEFTATQSSCLPLDN